MNLNHFFFEACAQVATKYQIKTYVVGGWVRDQLLNRPSKDIDIVVEGNGMDFAQKVAQEIDTNIQVNFFKTFGTAQFNYKDYDYEFVGARKESYDHNSRKPVVENGTIQEDIARRDFTINALAISLNEADYGQIIDFHQGLEHLKEKRLVTPLDPDQTYSDDPLRMLRAIRFANQLEFTIDSESFKSIQKNANRIQIISQERIHTELNKILMCAKPSIGLDLLYKSKLMVHFLPELTWLHGVEEYKGKGHKDNFYHTLQVVDNIATMTDNLWLRWAALLHDIAKPQTKSYSESNGWSFHGHEVLGPKMAHKIFKNLKLPLDKPLEYVKKLIYLHLRPISLTKEIVTDSAVRRMVYEAGNDIDDLLVLCRADITSKNEAKVSRYIQNLDALKIKIEEIEARDQIKNFQPPISGDVIIKTFQLKPGPEVGIIKNKIKDAILDGEIPNEYQAAFDFMMRLQGN